MAATAHLHSRLSPSARHPADCLGRQSLHSASFGEGNPPAGGFTIIETLIVLALIAVLASIAIPNLLRGQTSANESAVIATLKTFANAQMQFKSMGLVDVDGDGGAEYALVGELCGCQPLRGTSAILEPTLLRVSLGTVDPSGRILRHGYFFALYLPDAAGKGLAETQANLSAIDPLLARDYWTMLAWPVQKGTTGRETFFVNQQGQVLQAVAPYSGVMSVPPAGSGLVGPDPDRIDSQELAAERVGADGNYWVTVQ